MILRSVLRSLNLEMAISLCRLILRGSPHKTIFIWFLVSGSYLLNAGPAHFCDGAGETPFLFDWPLLVPHADAGLAHPQGGLCAGAQKVSQTGEGGEDPPCFRRSARAPGQLHLADEADPQATFERQRLRV